MPQDCASGLSPPGAIGCCLLLPVRGPRWLPSGPTAFYCLASTRTRCRRALGTLPLLDQSEELLNDKNVTIPSSDREGREEEARLYGTEYHSLEDAITEILVEETTGRKMEDPGLLDG